MSSSEPVAVIFDLDGLLVDTEPVWSESARMLLERRGRRYDPALKLQFMGRHPLEVARMMVAHYELAEAPEALRQVHRQKSVDSRTNLHQCCRRPCLRRRSAPTLQAQICSA